MERYKDPEWLRKQIKEEHRSLGQIARSEGVSVPTITKWAKRAGLSRSAYRKIQRSIFYPTGATEAERKAIQQGLQEWVDGLLLGGGSLISRFPDSAHYTQASVHRVYLEWIKEKFAQYGIGQRGKIGPMLPQKGRVEWRYESSSHLELGTHYNRWYGSGKKTIPEDFDFSPLVGLLWYLRGGSLERDKRRKGEVIRINFSVFRYTQSERDRLVAYLAQLRCKPVCGSYRNSVKIRIYRLEPFFDYIGDCPPELVSVLGYKWPEVGKGK